jgi:hypothetical protein
LKRLEYHFHAGVSEWWENHTDGLEQGWTFAERPAGTEPIVIKLQITGARVGVQPNRVEMISPQGLSVRYHELQAKDATGRALPARFEQDPEGVRIVVDDHDARYPIVIDPIFQTFAWSAESGQVNAYFGFSVAGAGDVNDDGYADLVVGAYQYDNGNTDEGAAFLFLGTVLGPSDTTAWSAEGNQNSAWFGYSVAGAGDVNGDGKSDVIVGAYLYDDGSADEGEAFVYHGTSIGLTNAAAWAVDSDQGGANFGLSVAGAGDVNNDGYDDVIVGSPNRDTTLLDEGAAHIFLGGAGGLNTTPAWTKPGEQLSANFGQAVAGAGDVNNDGYDDVIVGAHRWQDALVGPNDEGAAFVFLGSSSGVSLTPVWRAESNQAPQPDFGFAVAGAGDVNNDGYDDVLVGAQSYDAPQIDEGRVYLYFGSASGPVTSASWTGESNIAGGSYGSSIAAAGDVNNDGFGDFLVGAPLTEGPVQTDEGRVYLYFGMGTNPGVQSTVFVMEGNQTGAKFGQSVAGPGDINADGYDDVLVGAPEFSMDQSKEGRAFVYLGSEAGMGTQLGVWLSDGGQGGSAYALSVARAGDVNNDGYSDVIIGARQYDNGQTDEGRAFAFYGTHQGLKDVANWTAEIDQGSANFGQAVASAGDVNGDGFDDVIIGAPKYDNGQLDEGGAFVYLGSATGLATSYAWTVESNQKDANFGVSVASAGDVNGDGYDEVIVGANLYDNGQDAEGMAFLYTGSSGGLSLSHQWSTDGNAIGANYGFSVASAGDVNNDGYDEIIVGAPLFNEGLTGNGKAFLYKGSATGLPTTADWTAIGSLMGVNLGNSVACAGNINGDVYDDVIVGAYKFANGQALEGAAFVFHGGAAGLSTSVNWTIEGDQGSAQMGESVAGAGDVNDDGYGDIIVGASTYDNGETDEGAAFVYLGPGGGSGGTRWVLENNQQGANLGHSVAGAGDIDADGYADVIVGASAYDNPPLTDEGSAQVFMGSACVGQDGLDNDNDGFTCPFDCNDRDIDVFPGAGDATCDGIDDDCNGTQDEDFVAHGTTCGMGVCARTGVATCVLGVEQNSCVAGQPTAPNDTTCDGIDQDCSGTNDEEYAPVSTNCGFNSCATTGTTSCPDGTVHDSCVPLTPPSVDDTTCDGFDDDCSGTNDEDYVGAPTSCGVGGCARVGSIACVGGVTGDNCVPGAPAANDATCDDVDDDCDTFKDEDYVSELRHCGEGVCDATGMSSCSAGGVESDNCTPGSPISLTDTNCNDIDEDCNNGPDDDYVEVPTTCGTFGACVAAGTMSCNSGVEQDSCTPGTPAADDATCDGIDDDCSGTADEDGLCFDAGSSVGSDAGQADAAADSKDAGGSDAAAGGAAGTAGAAGAGGGPGGQGGIGGAGAVNGNAGEPANDDDAGPTDRPHHPTSHRDGGSGTMHREAGVLPEDKFGPREKGCGCSLPGSSKSASEGPVLIALALLLCRKRRSRR